MADNEFMLKLIAMLDQSKSKRQINSDVKALEGSIRNLRLTATLAKGTSKQQINQTIKQLEGQLSKIKLQAKFDQKNLKADIDKALQNISFKDIDIGVNEGKTKLKVQKVVADVKKTVQNNPISLNIDLKKEKLNNDITTYLSKHSKIRESESLLKQVDSLRNKVSGINDSDSLRSVTQEFQLFKSECAATGYAAKSSTEKIKNLIGSVTKVGSSLGIASLAVSNFQKSLKTIKTNDSILTEISKTSNSTKQELEELGNSAFDTASKFGRLSSDYLTAIQEMNRSGFYGEAGKALGELTLLTQASGDVSAETAQNYLLATNAAYGYAGNVEKLTAVLDGQNKITNTFSVDMESMAQATEKAGSMAANTGTKIDELSAMIGTISARTKEAGSITGTGIKALLVNLQNISSDKIVGTLEKANASMTETVNGVEKLRTPIAILKDLAKTYNSLDESDPLKSEITTNIGGKHHSNQLSALLSGWSDFEKMIETYADGAGSALEEADKSANNLEGRLNALSNSWTELVNAIVNKNTIKGGVGFLDTLLQSATKLIDTFDMLPVALSGITAFMTAKNKDYGITKVFDADTKKLSLEGNLFGIDFTQLKHFKEAEIAIAGWNKEVLKGKIDINKFGEEVVKNNKQLREYLSTCTDGSASLTGYKKHLQAAGEATNGLRLSTILLNSALSFGIGLAIQGVISGLDYLIHKEEKAAEALEEAKNKFTQTTDEIKSLNDELASAQDKIAELQKLADNGTISVADENELKLLKETNDELERKIALKQKEQIDDAKDLLKNVQKNNKEKPYSISYYKPDGKIVTEHKEGDASEYLQDMIRQYQNVTKYSERDDTYIENSNKNISKQAEKVEDLIDAYEKLKDAGIGLTKEQQAEYDSALKAQDAYLLFSYNLNKTKEGFRALNEEQKRSVFNDRLLEQGLTEQEVKVVLKYIPEKNLDDYYDLDFDFPLPDHKDYETAEEYGKAYAEAWQKGVDSAIRNNNKEEVKPTSFKEAWKFLDNKQDFLELAQAGALTVEKFNGMKGAEELMGKTSLSAEELTRKINKLVSSASQLESMGSGIKSLSDNLATKKESPKKAISYDTLAGMPDELKECTEAWKNYEKVMGTASSTYDECCKATDKLATAFINSNNFLANLTNSTKDYYISQLQAMGVSNAEAIVTAVLTQRHQEAAEAKQIESIKNEALIITKNGVTNETLKEVDALFQQENATKNAQYAIVNLIAQEQILSNTSLGVDTKIEQLRRLAETYYGTAAAASFMNMVQTSSDGALSSGETVPPDQAWKNVTKDAQKKEKKKAKRIKPVVPTPTVSPINYSTPKTSSSGGKGKSTKTKESRQRIDWISRMLDTLQNKVDMLKAKFENLFSIGKKKNNLTNQIKKTTKLLNAQEEAASRYQKIADSYYKKNKKALSKNGITLSMLQNGSYDVKSYKSSIAEIIQTYEDYIDKAQEAKKAAIGTKTAVRELKIQRNQLYIDRADSKLSAIDAQAENQKNAKAKNKYLQKKVKWTKQYYNYQIKNAKLEKDATKEAELQAQKKKALLDIEIQKNQNLADDRESHYNLNQKREENAVTAKEKNKYEAESLKNIKDQYKYQKEIAKLEHGEKSAEYKLLEEEEKAKIAESYQKMYDNIKTEYENRTGLNDAQITTVQAEIATLEAAGKSATKAMYEGMMKITSDTKEKRLKELADLEEAGKNFEYGSEKWYAWQNDLEAVKQGLYDCTQQTIEFQKKVNELDFKKFALAAAQLDATKSHLDFLVDMLSHEDLTSKESGGFTDAGMATVSLKFSNIDNHKKIIENAQNDLKELYAKHADGSDFLTEEEFLAKREEQLDIIRDSISAIADEKDAILDLVENALQLQIDSINELIEKKKKALIHEKEYWEYQRKIAKQTKNIALIEKQIAALSGDRSEEAMAKVQKLKVSLEEAKEDLKDTEYDRWHDDQNEMLDNLADEVEDFWEQIMNDLRKDINGSLDKLMQMVTDNPDAIARALDALGLGDALSIITAYNPDGTHTDKAIDYGGNSYESTYQDDTGENVNNTFKTEYEKLHSSLDNLYSTTEEAVRKAAEEAERMALEERKKTEEEAKKKADSEAAERMKKEYAVRAADQRADSIMKQSADGVKSFVIDNVPMEGVQAAVEDFLNSSALHKPTTEAGKNRMKTDPLLKYIAEKYKGKTLSNANEARLGAYLGIPVKDMNNVTTSEANKILKAFQDAGFAKGGVADTLNRAASENGDDGLITIQRGEAVLTQEQTEAVKNMAERFVKAEPMFTEEQLNIIRENIETPDYSNVLPRLDNAIVNNNNTNNTSVNMGDINVHLDGSGVTDMESMFEQLSKPVNRQRMTQCVLGDPKNPFQSILGTF